MLHRLLDGRPWFRPKRFGYGAGPPIAWQGWALLASYMAAMIGLGLLGPLVHGLELAALIMAMLALTGGLVLVARVRTEGEWRWRWGDDD